MFKRGKGKDEANLFMNMRIPLVDALTGFATSVDHLDGHPIDIDRAGLVTPCGHVMRVKGEGMPIKDQHEKFGDLLVTFEIKFPSKIDANTQTKLRNLLGSVRY